MACEWVAEVVLQLSQISRVVGDLGGVAFCGEFGGDGGLVVSLSALLTPPRGQPGGIPDSACQCRILFSALLCVILSLSALLPRWS